MIYSGNLRYKSFCIQKFYFMKWYAKIFSLHILNFINFKINAIKYCSPIGQNLSHRARELTTGNLKELETMKVNIIQEQFCSSKEENRDGTMTTAEIKEMLSLYHKVAEFREKKHS